MLHTRLYSREARPNIQAVLPEGEAHRCLTLKIHRVLMLELNVDWLACHDARSHEATHIHIHCWAPLGLAAHLLGKLLHRAQVWGRCCWGRHHGQLWG